MDSEKAEFEKRSPKAEEIFQDTKILMLAGKRDRVVPPTQTKEFSGALRRAGKDVREENEFVTKQRIEISYYVLANLLNRFEFI